ncbi:hypothetical protein HYH03_006439 [Edaphochlamys debaryana]|uniref:Uncharacterized protein n=1 Tax=Edaphochlamys debaryana TaxID=47281 RepID=A0A835Y3S0_9CHLO|nr:hypothetical protein HYH03_006439 [Edaphochlamys debaryana]|eukprot:KAG2495495.1 hypothetical protein HYH03_006439 [Edaphochlamys debaryana]
MAVPPTAATSSAATMGGLSAAGQRLGVERSMPAHSGGIGAGDVASVHVPLSGGHVAHGEASCIPLASLQEALGCGVHPGRPPRLTLLEDQQAGGGRGDGRSWEAALEQRPGPTARIVDMGPLCEDPWLQAGDHLLLSPTAPPTPASCCAGLPRSAAATAAAAAAAPRPGAYWPPALMAPAGPKRTLVRGPTVRGFVFCAHVQIQPGPTELPQLLAGALQPFLGARAASSLSVSLSCEGDAADEPGRPLELTVLRVVKDNGYGDVYDQFVIEDLAAALQPLSPPGWPVQGSTLELSVLDAAKGRLKGVMRPPSAAEAEAAAAAAGVAGAEPGGASFKRSCGAPGGGSTGRTEDGTPAPCSDGCGGAVERRQRLTGPLGAAGGADVDAVAEPTRSDLSSGVRLDAGSMVADEPQPQPHAVPPSPHQQEQPQPQPLPTAVRAKLPRAREAPAASGKQAERQLRSEGTQAGPEQRRQRVAEPEPAAAATDDEADGAAGGGGGAAQAAGADTGASGSGAGAMVITFDTQRRRLQLRQKDFPWLKRFMWGRDEAVLGLTLCREGAPDEQTEVILLNKPGRTGRGSTYNKYVVYGLWTMLEGWAGRSVLGSTLELSSPSEGWLRGVLRPAPFASGAPGTTSAQVATSASTSDAGGLVFQINKRQLKLRQTDFPWIRGFMAGRDQATLELTLCVKGAPDKQITLPVASRTGG